MEVIEPELSFGAALQEELHYHADFVGPVFGYMTSYHQLSAQDQIER